MWPKCFVFFLLASLVFTVWLKYQIEIEMGSRHEFSKVLKHLVGLKQVTNPTDFNETTHLLKIKPMLKYFAESVSK